MFGTVVFVKCAVVTLNLIFSTLNYFILYVVYAPDWILVVAAKVQ